MILCETEVRRDPGYRWENAGRHLPHAILQYTEGGRGFFENDTAGSRIPIPEGWAFLTEVPSETRYGYDPEDSEPYQLTFFSLLGSTVRSLAAIFRHRHGPVIHLKAMPESFSLFRQIQRLYRERAFRDRFDESVRLFQFFAALKREAGAEAVRADPVAAFHQLIQHRFREPLNIKEMAASFSVSREHLSRAFRERYGQPPARLLRELRLREARLLVESGSASLDSIARATGFAEVRALKRALAGPPSNFSS